MINQRQFLALVRRIVDSEINHEIDLFDLEGEALVIELFARGRLNKALTGDAQGEYDFGATLPLELDFPKVLIGTFRVACSAGARGWISRSTGAHSRRFVDRAAARCRHRWRVGPVDCGPLRRRDGEPRRCVISARPWPRATQPWTRHCRVIVCEDCHVRPFAMGIFPANR